MHVRVIMACSWINFLFCFCYIRRSCTKLLLQHSCAVRHTHFPFTGKATSRCCSRCLEGMFYEGKIEFEIEKWGNGKDERRMLLRERC